MAAPGRAALAARMSPDAAYAAGWDDGADDPPLTDAGAARLAGLLAPYIQTAARAA